MFAAWLDHSFFVGVHIGPCGSIAWSDRIDLCDDALYMQITGMTPEEMFPTLMGQVIPEPLARTTGS